MASEYTAFFECLREHEDRLRFLLMTGTTRCITTGFDWVFRWLTDITFDADTSDNVGFTRKDLGTTFLPWVQRAAQTTGLTPVDVMIALKPGTEAGAFLLRKSRRCCVPGWLTPIFVIPTNG